jgi:hypothetical protein
MTNPATPTPQRPFTLTYSGEGTSSRRVHSEKLSAYDLDRLWRVAYSFFSIPHFLESTPGPRHELTLQAPNGSHSVVWNGFPPAQIAELVGLVDQLGSKRGGSRKGVWIGVGAAAAVVAAVVVVLLVVVLPGKDPTPAAPSAVKAVAGKGSVTVSWAASDHADHYQLFKDNKPLKTVTTTSYTDALPQEDSTDSHTYYVVAVSDKDKTSAKSASVKKAPQLRDLNADEKAFITKLPRDFAEPGSCVPAPFEESSTIDVAVSCSVSDAAAVKGSQKPSGGFLAFHAINRDAYTEKYLTETRGVQQANFTCEQGRPAAGNWHNSQNVDLGKIWCTTTGSSVDSGTALLGWTTLESNSFIVLFGDRDKGTAGIKSLIDFWDNTPYVSVAP